MEQNRNSTSNDFLKTDIFKGITEILEKDSNLDIFSSRKRIQLDSAISESNRKIDSMIKLNRKASDKIKLLKKTYGSRLKSNTKKLASLQEKI